MVAQKERILSLEQTLGEVIHGDRAAHQIPEVVLPSQDHLCRETHTAGNAATPPTKVSA